jgi:DNA-directed RNA polymerase beta subunit
VWALPLWPQATPTSQGEELAEFGRNAFVPTTGDQRNEDNDKLCQRELSAAGEVLGAFLGDRLNEVEKKCEQSLIKIDRGRRFFGSSCLSSFNCQYMNALVLYALIRLCLKSTALTLTGGSD